MGLCGIFWYVAFGGIWKENKEPIDFVKILARSNSLDWCKMSALNYGQGSNKIFFSRKNTNLILVQLVVEKFEKRSWLFLSNYFFWKNFLSKIDWGKMVKIWIPFWKLLLRIFLFSFEYFVELEILIIMLWYLNFLTLTANS